MYRKINKCSNIAIDDIFTKLTIQRQYPCIVYRDGDIELTGTPYGNRTSGGGYAALHCGNCTSYGGNLTCLDGNFTLGDGNFTLQCGNITQGYGSFTWYGGRLSWTCGNATWACGTGTSLEFKF